MHTKTKLTCEGKTITTKRKWVSDLKENGYKFIASSKANKSEVYATKFCKSTAFKGKTDWDVYTLEPGETYFTKIYDGSVWRIEQ